MFSSHAKEWGMWK